MLECPATFPRAHLLHRFVSLPPPPPAPVPTPPLGRSASPWFPSPPVLLRTSLMYVRVVDVFIVLRDRLLWWGSSCHIMRCTDVAVVCSYRFVAMGCVAGYGTVDGTVPDGNNFYRIRIPRNSEFHWNSSSRVLEFSRGSSEFPDFRFPNKRTQATTQLSVLGLAKLSSARAVSSPAAGFRFSHKLHNESSAPHRAF
jgi:hypothetical protein